MKSGVFMKIRKGFSLVKANGQNVVLCDKSIIKDFTSNIVLNETSSYLWQLVSEDENITKEGMLNKLLQRYDISTVLALNDIDVFDVPEKNPRGFIEFCSNNKFLISQNNLEIYQIVKKNNLIGDRDKLLQLKRIYNNTIIFLPTLEVMREH